MFTGEALVEFASNKDYQSAFLKNRRHIGHRYVEIFKSSGAEIDTTAGRSVRPLIQHPASQFVVRMRGLPYSATDDDIYKFFEKSCRSSAIHLIKAD